MDFFLGVQLHFTIDLMHRLWKMFLHLPELSNAFVKGDKIRP